MAEATSAPPPGGFPTRRLRRLRRAPALRRLVAETRLGWTTSSPRSSCAREPEGRSRSRPCPVRCNTRSTRSSSRPNDSSLGRARAHPLRGPGPQGRRGERRVGTGRASCRRAARSRATRWVTAVPHGGPLPRRVHRPRALRHPRPDGEVLNDPTLAASPAHRSGPGRGGCDVVAPSGMMDGQVAAIRARARRRGARRCCHPGLRLEVRLHPLRPVPRPVDSRLAAGGDRRAYQQTRERPERAGRNTRRTWPRART